MTHKWGLKPLLAAALMVGSAALAQVISGPSINITPTQARNNTRFMINAAGTKVAYTYNGLWSKNDAWVMDISGQHQLQVWYKIDDQNHVDSRADEWPSLNADGTKVLFHSWAPDSSQTDIFVMDLDTGVTTQLTSAATNEAWPHFSPDGTKVVFLSNRVNATYQVFVMDVAPESATNTPKKLSDFSSVTYARFAPDGQHLLMSAIAASHPGEREIYRMDAADANADGVGDNLTRLTNMPGYIAEQPSQPTAGSRIFFVANYSPDGKLHVFSMAPNGSDIRQVTASDYEDRFMYAAGDKLGVSFNVGMGGWTAGQGYGNADIELYTLVNGTANGTLNGRVVTAPGKGVDGASVEVFNGATSVQSVTADAQGRFSVSLPPGGYMLKFDAFGVVAENTYRGVIVPPGATVAKDFSVPSSDAPAPGGLMPTVVGNTVDLRWAAVTTSYEVSGYNVFRAPSENGPWTKVNQTLIPASGTPSFVDTNPGDLYSAYYTVTAVTTDSFTQWESGMSDVVQAANNLMFNPSFEIADATGKPLGWKHIYWGGDNVGSTDTAEHATGARAAFIQTGTNRGTSMWHTDGLYAPPATPGDKYVFGMYGRLKDAPTPSGVVALTCADTSNTGAGTDWYEWDPHGTTSVNGTQDPNRPWAWLYNQTTLSSFEESKYTRYTLYWNDGGTAACTAGLSRAYYDEVRFQVRRVGAKGVVVGRVLGQDGSPIPGATVTIGDLSATSGEGGLFIIRDVPTGPVSLKTSLAIYEATAEAKNIGGARVDIVMPPMVPLSFTGTVKMADGAPVPNAPVRLVYGVGEDTNQTTLTTTTNAQGQYTFADPPKGAGATAIVATVPGYRAGRVTGTFGSYGDLVKDITIGDAAPLIQVPKATAAPTIDGVINTAEWAAAAQIPMNVGLQTPGTETVAYAMWDSANLYLAFAGAEPNPSGMKARAASRDAQPLWYYADIDSWNADDVYEIELDPNMGGEAGYGYERWQTMFNSNTNGLGMADIAWRNAVPNMWGGGLSINGYTFKSNVDTDVKTWFAELKVPAADLAVPNGLNNLSIADGTQWQVDLHRHRHQPEPSGEDLWASDSGWVTMTFVNAIVAMKGDLNNNGVVDLADARIAARIAGGLEAAGTRAAQGDVAGNDQAITTLDAASIARKATGLGPDFQP